MTATNANITGTVNATSGVFAGNIQTFFQKMRDIGSILGSRLEYTISKYVNIFCEGNDRITLKTTADQIGKRVVIINFQEIPTSSGSHDTMITTYSSNYNIIHFDGSSTGKRYKTFYIQNGYVELVAYPSSRNQDECWWVILGMEGYTSNFVE